MKKKALGVLALLPVLGFAMSLVPHGGNTSLARVVSHFRIVGSASAVDLNATIDQASAIASALANLSYLDPTVSGYHVKSVTFTTGLTQVTDIDTGEVIYTANKAHDAWVIFFAAPPQNGYQTVAADSIVDGLSGKVVSAEAFSQVAADAPNVLVSPIPGYTDVDNLANQGDRAPGAVGVPPQLFDPTVPNTNDVSTPSPGPCPPKIPTCGPPPSKPRLPVQTGPIHPQ